jgi:hypothetical protein
MRDRVRSALMVLMLAVAARPVVAQEPNHLYDTWQVSASLAGVILGTNIRVDGEEGQGTDLDTEDDLGLDRAGVRPRLGVRWHPWKRHQFEAAFIFIDRDGRKAIERDVTIDSVTYTAGAELVSDLKTNQLAFAYRYAIHASERSQIGLSLGLGATFFRGTFTGTGTITDGSQTETGTFTYESKLTGPTVALGGFGQWRVGQAWYVEADLRALYVPIDNISVTIVDVGGAVRYFPLAWLGLEAGYSLSGFKAEIEQKEDPLIDLGLAGRVRYLTQNVRAGAIVAF